MNSLLRKFPFNFYDLSLSIYKAVGPRSFPRLHTENNGSLFGRVSEQQLQIKKLPFHDSADPVGHESNDIFVVRDKNVAHALFGLNTPKEV